MPRDNRRGQEVEQIDLEEIPPIALPFLSVFLIYAAFSMGFSNLVLNLALAGVGVVFAGAFIAKAGLLYQQRGPGKAIDWALTAPADRQEDYSVNLERSSGIKKTDKGITLDHLKEIDPYEFEEFVAKVWHNMGYHTEVTQGSGDRGIDVVAKKEEPYRQKKLIQVKRKGDGKKVRPSTIRKLNGLKQQDDVDEVIAATSTTFTPQAREEAKKYNVKLIDGKKLLELYQENVES